jgi:hypothetical protein
MFDITQPKFNKPEEFWQWKREWADYHKQFSEEIRQQKRMVKNHQRRGCNTAFQQRRLAYMRKNAQLLMKLLEEGWEEYHRRKQGMAELQEQLDQYPLQIPKAKEIVFHFNKGHLFNDLLPMWVVKCKGKVFYVHHVKSDVPWDTKETPNNPSTKGSIKFKNAGVQIDKNGNAHIYQINDK